MRNVHKVGDDAPLFDVETIDGRKIRLADLRGKVVLLDFWVANTNRNRHKVQAAYEKYKDDPRLVIIGFCMASRKNMNKHLAEKPMPWLQVHHGPKMERDVSIIGDYGEFPPVLVLVGPDGKLLSRWLELRTSSKLQPLLDNTMAALPELKSPEQENEKISSGNP